MNNVVFTFKLYGHERCISVGDTILISNGQAAYRWKSYMGPFFRRGVFENIEYGFKIKSIIAFDMGK